MKAYSKDLRIRVIDAVDRGVPRAEVAQQFHVSLRTIKRWPRRRRALGTLAVSPRPGPPARKLGPLRAGLLPQLEAQPDATLAEHCARWEAATGVRVSTASMSRVISPHFGWTRKKPRTASLT
jgi:transposase